MFRLTRAIINNLNQFKYIKNINSLELKRSYNDSDSETKDLVKDNNYSLDELKRLETEVRENNLKVFLNNYFHLRLDRFLCVSFPAMLTAGAIAFCSVPTKYEGEGAIRVYHGNHMLYNSELGETQYTTGHYIELSIDEEFDGMLEDEYLEETDSLKEDEVILKIFDNINSVVANFKLNNDGRLFIKNAKSGEYVNVSEYEKYEYSEVDNNFDEIINQAIEVLNNTSTINFSDENKALLNSLTASEKKVIIAEIIKYTDTEDISIMMTKSRWLVKFICLVLAAAYIAFEYNQLKYRTPKFTVGIGKKLENVNGELIEGKYNEKCGMIYGPLKAREEFLAAERDRIIKIKEEIEKNVIIAYPSKCPILTRYERKLKPKR